MDSQHDAGGNAIARQRGARCAGSGSEGGGSGVTFVSATLTTVPGFNSKTTSTLMPFVVTVTGNRIGSGACASSGMSAIYLFEREHSTAGVTAGFFCRRTGEGRGSDRATIDGHIAIWQIRGSC